MARETIFIVQSFRGTRGSLVPEIPIIAANQFDACVKAAAASMHFIGVVAYSRSGDLSTGVYDDPQILASHGEVPGTIVDLVG